MNPVFLCPGQGAQAVGMGKGWFEASPAARAVFEAADRTLSLPGGAKLSALCFNGPAETLNRTDVSQPALYTCGIACARVLAERGMPDPVAAAGLSLGEYTALHLAGAFSFEDGLRLVATRGRLMQQAAESSKGGMVALIGADEAQAAEACSRTLAACGSGEVLVSANFNAPGQIVLSGSAAACAKAVEIAGELGLRATALQVAGAFHSPLMAPAAEGLAAALDGVTFHPLRCDVWSNVTARPHERENPKLLKKLLVDQLVNPVRWSQSCSELVAWAKGREETKFIELAPGSVLKGLFRRIDRSAEVTSNDQPS